MTPVPMQCPLCAGMIQIDPAYAGQQVACPLCQGVMALPPPEFFGLAPGPFPPPGYSHDFPLQYPQEPPANLPQLGCPVCGGAFQVSPEMVGQQVACPHCRNAVSIPDIFGGGVAPGMSSAPMQPAQQEMAAGPMQFIGLPPGIGAAPELPPSLAPPTDLGAESGIPCGMAVTADQQQPALAGPSSQPVAGLSPPASQLKTPATAGEARESRTGNVDANLYPPGMTPKEAAAPMKEQPAPPRDDRFPPGMGKPRDRESPPRQRPITQREQLYPPGFTPREEVSLVQETVSRDVDELLPPGAAAAGDLPSAVDDLLPPGAAAATTAEPESPSRGQDVVDSLLPPGAPTDPASMPTEQVALPDAPTPTPGGDYVTVQNKEGVKTISRRGEEIEIRKLSPEERARRRRVKNIVMFTLAVLVLVVVIVIMTRK